ncbi:hypothetical protein [Capnocytophaga felis]|uniref:Uncharacterized protein n=1 Tax=Capnocytophaga felis TaxID=2267611 RepID=A0A5M4B6K5_9FLAO|nr:hypothetical protein [Capnocytophaga felis]GET45254.1 hypothetical protein RCZ01_05560 [Capnocytophaga felis]GET47583.1 hypothetical protein RCZ02_04140 [Capnocytophaga felis]
MNKVAKRKQNDKTTFLLPKKNFWIGVGSVLNIFGVYFTYNYSKTTEQADKKAITCDWTMVGNDFKKVLNIR